MTKDLWVNLPVKNVQESVNFFIGIGFKLNKKYPASNEAASFLVGDKPIVLMLFSEEIFKSAVQHEISNTQAASQVLFSIDAQSKEGIDDLAKKVTAAGGKIYSKPSENEGWMYGFGFTDLDGHRWNALYMDFAKMPKQ